MALIGKGIAHTPNSVSGLSGTGGNCSWAAVMALGSSIGANKPTDDASNTYTALTLIQTAGFQDLRFFYCFNPSFNAGTLTFSYGGGGLYTMAAGILSNIDTGTAPVQTSNATGNGTSMQPGSQTPGGDGYQLLAFGNIYPGTSPSINNSFDASGMTMDPSAGVYFGGLVGYLQQLVAAALNPTISFTGASDVCCGMVRFKSLATAGPPAMHHRRMMAA